MALDVEWGSSADGTNVRVWEPNGCASQAFDLVQNNAVSSLGRTLADGVYTITSMLNGSSVVDVQWASKDEGGNIWLYENGNWDNQRFEVKLGQDGYYTFKAVSSGCYVCVQDFNNGAGANVCQTFDGSGLNAKWTLKKQSDGSYEVISALTGLLLDVDNSKTTNGTNIDVWHRHGGAAQRFSFGGSRTIADGYYVLDSAVGAGKVVDVASASVSPGAPVQLYSYNGAANQRFKVSYVGSGYYTIICVASGLSLSVSGDADSGSPVLQQPQTGGEEQLWSIVSNPAGDYSIVSAKSGMALDVKNGSSVDGTTIRVWEPSGLASQTFSFSIPEMVEAGTYLIRSSVGADSVLDVEDASRFDGANIQIRNNEEGASQWFTISPEGDGTYAITAWCSGKNLDVAWSGQADGTNVWQWAANGFDCQKWIIVSSGGKLAFLSACNLKALDVCNGDSTDGANIQMYTINYQPSQQFECVKPTRVLPDGYYYVSSALDGGYVADIENGGTDDGANLQVYAYNGGDNQIFHFLYAGDGFYTIQVASSNKCLDVAWSGQADGTNVWQWAANGFDCQKWRPVRNDDGTYTFFSKSNGKVLDVAWGDASNGTNIRTWTSNGLPAQKFALTLANPSITYEQLSITLDQMTAWQMENEFVSKAYTYDKVKARLDPLVALSEGRDLEFVDLRVSSGLTADQLDAYISSTPKGKSGVLNGQGASFLAAAKAAGVNEVYFVCHCILETGWGTSDLALGTKYDGLGFWYHKWNSEAKRYDYVWNSFPGYPAGTYYNFFGIGAFDTDANRFGIERAIQQQWNSKESAIFGAARWISSNYINRSINPQYTLYKMKWDYNTSDETGELGQHQYATDIFWSDSIANNMKACYERANITSYTRRVVPSYR